MRKEASGRSSHLSLKVTSMNDSARRNVEKSFMAADHVRARVDSPGKGNPR